MAGSWLMLPVLGGILLGELATQGKRAVNATGPWAYIFRGKRIVLGDEFGRRNWGNIKKVPRELVDERNVKAFLAVIREGESRQSEDAYRLMNGGELFTAPPWRHPRRVGRGGTSTAAGAFQFVEETWDGLVKNMKLADFSPANQRLAALGHLAWLGALPDVIAGNTRSAYRKCASRRGWTSLPGGPERPQSADSADAVFRKYGGVLSGM